MNKRAIECLIKCGGLDSTGASRRGMLEVLPQAQASGQKRRTTRCAARLDLRPRGRWRRRGPDGRGVHGPAAADPSEEFGQRELLTLEKETLGVPLVASAPGGPRRAARGGGLLAGGRRGKQDGAWVTVGGIVAEAKKVRTRSGGYVMFAKLDDLEGQVELFVRDATSEQAGRSRSTGWSWSAGGSTKKAATR